MVFQAVLSRFPGADRARIAACLNALAGLHRTGTRIHANLFAEYWLPDSSAHEILFSLHACSQDGPGIQGAFEPTCWRHQLRGPPMLGARPILLGRTVTATRFRKTLVKQRLFPTDARARDWLETANTRPLPEIQRKMRGLPMADHLVWATYCAADRSRDPFDALPTHPEYLQDALGLPLFQRHEDLLLFVYTVPPHFPLLFPTVADAGWNDVFQPASPTSVEAGWTLPTSQHPSVQPQPEVVHASLPCEFLARPLRVLPADPAFVI